MCLNWKKGKSCCELSRREGLCDLEEGQHSIVLRCGKSKGVFECAMYVCHICHLQVLEVPISEGEILSYATERGLGMLTQGRPNPKEAH